MNYGLRKVFAVLLLIFIVVAWYFTAFGIGEIDSIKDLMKLGLDIKGGVYVVLEADTEKTGEELARDGADAGCNGKPCESDGAF